MQEFLDIMTQPWAIRAITASLLVGITCGVLGVFIVLRNMSLLGDALSHSVLPGIVVAFIFFGYSPLGFFGGAIAAGLLSTALITWIQQNAKTRNDAAIGIVFTVMFSLGIIGISWLNNKENVHLDLKDFLFGNVLAVTPGDLSMSVVVSIYSVTTIVVFYRYFFATTFQPVVAQVMGISVKATHYLLMFMLSFAVVSAMRTVGVILVVAMLITPASTALLFYNQLRKVLFFSGFLGFLSAVLGFILAVLLDSNPGPMMVLVAGLIYGISVFFAPEKGLIQKWRLQRQHEHKVWQEDIIKWLVKNNNIANHSIPDLSKALDISYHKIKSALNVLIKKGYVTQDDTGTHLTLKGIERGNAIIRAHRLWETYQVNKMGMHQEHIHPDAERLEHKLTPDIVDEVEEKLGFPKTDPHGSPIPPRKNHQIKKSLLSLYPRQKGKIANSQINNEVEGLLWEMNLFPDTVITLVRVEKENVIIEAGKKQLAIPAKLAGQINMI